MSAQSLPAMDPALATTSLGLSIVIPCFNEAETIVNTVSAVQLYLSQHFASIKTELLLINDGSTDNTLDLMQDLAKQYENLRIESYPVNKGRGEAIKIGIQRSQGYYIILLDADLTYDVNHIGEIMAVFSQSPKTDAVVVSPYMKGGEVAGVPFKRLLLSRCANWLLGGFFEGRFSTVTCVVRGYRGDLIRRVYLADTGKELHLEILRKLLLYGANIQEIPGRLIWKTDKGQPRRSNNLKVVSSAQKHFMYGLMVRPTRYFKYVALVLFLLGMYEIVAIGLQIFSALDLSLPLNEALRQALLSSYNYSPYSFFIGIGALIMAFQTISFLIILQTQKHQQEEMLRHMLVLLEEKNKSLADS